MMHLPLNTPILIYAMTDSVFSYFLLFFSTNVVMNYTEIEAKVRAATNDDAWGPTGNST